MGKSGRFHSFIWGQSVCVSVTPASLVNTQTGWFHLLTLVVGLRITAVALLMPVIISGLLTTQCWDSLDSGQQVQASPGRSEREPASSRSPMVGLMNALNHTLVTRPFAPVGLDQVMKPRAPSAVFLG